MHAYVRIRFSQLNHTYLTIIKLERAYSKCFGPANDNDDNVLYRRSWNIIRGAQRVHRIMNIE